MGQFLRRLVIKRPRLFVAAVTVRYYYSELGRRVSVIHDGVGWPGAGSLAVFTCDAVLPASTAAAADTQAASTTPVPPMYSTVSPLA